MIIDLPRFIAHERPSWTELETLLARIESDPYRRMPIEEVQRFHYLYQKISADLGRVATFASEPELRGYLESLTARAYGEIHESRDRERRFRPVHWFAHQFPRVFRRHLGAFTVSLLITFVSMLFGALATVFDEDAKAAILPGQFAHLLRDPAKRVAEEEAAQNDRLSGEHSQFAGMLMTNNIRVSVLTLALGVTFGIGTVVELFYNGVLLGLTCIDYILAGQTIFLLGWLLPHGVIEIPAILIAGQGGLLLGKSLIGWGDRTPLAQRLRLLGPDLMTLIGGVAVLLVWAGIVESFLSQHHEPALRYWQKIAFGVFELVVFVWFLIWKRVDAEKEP